MTDIASNPVKERQPILWFIVAGIGYIPLVGIPFGLASTIRGIITVKSHGIKLLVVALVSFIPMTIAYSSLFYMAAQKGGIFSKLDVQMKEHLLAQAVPSIEMHKVKTGKYPESVKELFDETSIKFISDSAGNMHAGYYYVKMDSGYVLGNVGDDSLQGTADDVVPILKDTVKLGIRNAVIGDMEKISAERFEFDKKSK